MLLKQRDNIDLLFSDIVLGSGMTGFDLAREAKLLRPDLHVLLTSGYERTADGSEPSDAVQYEILRKPYRREHLAAAVHKALDGQRFG
jgi:two-component SAPR family response regulator